MPHTASVLHRAVKAVVAAQQCCGVLHAPLQQRLPDAAGAYGFAVHGERRAALQREAQPGGQLRQAVEVVVVLAAEAAVVAQQQLAHIQTAVEQACRLAGGHLRHLLCEGQHGHILGASLEEQPQVLLGVVEPVFALAAAEHKGGMRRQRDHQPGTVHLRQQLLVPEVYAVEDPHRDGGLFGYVFHPSRSAIYLKHHNS